jgi:hypothetical protein
MILRTTVKKAIPTAATIPAIMMTPIKIVFWVISISGSLAVRVALRTLSMSSSCLVVTLSNVSRTVCVMLRTKSEK